MKRNHYITATVLGGLLPHLTACDSALEEFADVEAHAELDVDEPALDAGPGRLDAVAVRDEELSPELTLTEFSDGRRRFHARGVDGARELLTLVDEGDVDMEADVRAQLLRHAGGVNPEGGATRSYGPCITPVGSGAVLTQRKWLWVWSGWDVTASAQWSVPGFGPKPSVRAEALVCVNGDDCTVKTQVSVGPAISVGRLVALTPHKSVLAAAKVENASRTCYFAATFEYWP